MATQPTDYNGMTTRDMPTSRTATAAAPAPPELTKSAAMRMQRTRYGKMQRQGMSIAEMCRAMSDDELHRNAKRGGMAAIAEEVFRAGQYVAPDPELDLGV